ncbi:glycerol-3-phosphate dehydrogenase [Parasalinivibrio latis]|uniref:glycerol-3-phosphate dehydrogenase n=1 Tax=Parasalinivibrio latis TaxID=2952610 RepID=UPI003DA6B539
MTQANIEPVDLFVIGGGANGAGIARDASGRGLSVTLCEQGDLAEGTSSRSGKLIHGGLRYLEYYEFRLVKEALNERTVLLRSAPHIIWPLRFVLPLGEGKRPAWFIRLGLFLYDNLGGNRVLPGTATRDLRHAEAGVPLKDKYRRAFEYSDCWVDDARLVVLNALSAAEKGAKILTRTKCTSARRIGGYWHITTQNRDGQQQAHLAKGIVNAAGPWINVVNDDVLNIESKRRVRLVKGSHIVAKKFWPGDHAYLLQNPDKRVIFINPYLDDLCLIGTTDISYDGTPQDVAIDEGEIDYLLESLGRYFENPPRKDALIQTFSGVRPLFDDDKDNPSAVTRDYVFDVTDEGGKLPLLNIFGGKITTYRELAQHAMEKLTPYYPDLGPAWTATTTLPGGDTGNDIPAFIRFVCLAKPWLPEPLATHYVRLYGTRLFTLLGDAASMDDLGLYFGGKLYAREAEFLIRHEWAQTAEDILERRTKHGLFLTPEEKVGFEKWLATWQENNPYS